MIIIVNLTTLLGNFKKIGFSHSQLFYFPYIFACYLRVPVIIILKNCKETLM